MASILLAAGFMTVYGYGLILSDRYVQLLRIAELTDVNEAQPARAEFRTALTPVVLTVSRHLVPSSMCVRRTARSVALHTGGALHRCAVALEDPMRRGGCCRMPCADCCPCAEWDRERWNTCMCLTICMIVIIVPAVVCAMTDNPVACFFMAMLELLGQLLQHM